LNAFSLAGRFDACCAADSAFAALSSALLAFPSASESRFSSALNALLVSFLHLLYFLADLRELAILSMRSAGEPPSQPPQPSNVRLNTLSSPLNA